MGLDLLSCGAGVNYSQAIVSKRWRRTDAKQVRTRNCVFYFHSSLLLLVATRCIALGVISGAMPKAGETARGRFAAAHNGHALSGNKTPTRSVLTTSQPKHVGG